ncbi:hypothetical protein EVAR_14470_1 [Eumeta japonica]|uniref:Uncharacterized protein n=1 Tax=Eumeta variegata TaxID=151549 RepID=A0A4C1U2Z9_EUMVA|nr:hypothetical protein EVAR_14470_1 [Eumeta japonica]
MRGTRTLATNSVQYSNARGIEKERYTKIESRREKENYEVSLLPCEGTPRTFFYLKAGASRVVLFQFCPVLTMGSMRKPSLKFALTFPRNKRAGKPPRNDSSGVMSVQCFARLSGKDKISIRDEFMDREWARSNRNGNISLPVANRLTHATGVTSAQSRDYDSKKKKALTDGAAATDTGAICITRNRKYDTRHGAVFLDVIRETERRTCCRAITASELFEYMRSVQGNIYTAGSAFVKVTLRDHLIGACNLKGSRKRN